MEVPLLQALRDRDKYRLLVQAVPREMIGQEAGLMLDWFRLYYDQYSGHQRIDLDALDTLIKLRGSSYTSEQMALVKGLVNQLRRPIEESTVNGVVGQLMELDLSGRTAALVARFQAGEDINLTYELSKLAQDAKQRLQQSAPTDWIDEDIVDILNDEAGDHGIKLPTLLLSQSIKGLLGGASVAVAARPDKGKTSLMAKIATFCAAKIPNHFDDDRTLLWLNNEGKGRRIYPRVYQAALDCTVDELYEFSNQGVLIPKYTAAMGGRKDRVRIKDMHGANLAQIEQVIEAMKPCIVITDMPANFKLPGGGNGGNKADEIEQKWQELREMAVRHDFIHFGTCQISTEGGNMLFPPYSALKDSKTGIQGATDIIIMMGALDSAGQQVLRGLSTPKNKYAMAGQRSHVEGEVQFDAARCQFREGDNA